jgi:hypothetical protein
MSAIPPEELPILESLINIRNRLTALKKNSSDYIRAQDVQNLYQAVIKQGESAHPSLVLGHRKSDVRPSIFRLLSSLPYQCPS